MSKTIFSFLLCGALCAHNVMAQNFQEYLALFEPIGQDYGFAGNALKDVSEKKQPIAMAFRSFIDAKTDSLVVYYPFCVFSRETHHIVFLVCKKQNQPDRLSLVSRLYDSQGNLKPTRLDIGKDEGFLAHAGKDEDNAYSFFTQYEAKNARFSIYYTKKPTTNGIYRAYTLGAEGYTRYSPTADLAYNPYSNTTPYAPTADAVKIDYFKDKSVQIKVGQLAYLPAPVHGSVGIGANVTSTNEGILSYLDSHNAYHKTQMRGETGGDGATCTFIFRAEKVGKCYVIYKKYFRGKQESNYKIKVIVKK